MPNSRGFEDADLPQTAALFDAEQRIAAMPVKFGGFWDLQDEMPGFHLPDRSSLHPAGGRLGVGPFAAALKPDRLKPVQLET